MSSGPSARPPGLTRRSVLLAGAAATVAGTGLIACGNSSDSENDVRSIATDAYIFGYPMVLLEVTQRASQLAVNRITAVGPVDPNLNAVVLPNIDTLYVSAWLDLRAEPVVLDVPAMDGRYWLMQLMDAWTNTVHDPSSDAPQEDAEPAAPPYTFAITGPGWTGTLPPDVTQLPMPTATAWLLGRIELRNAGDLAAAQAAQQQVMLAPLSAWLGGERPAPALAPAVTLTKPPPQQVAELDGRAYFDRLCALLAIDPPLPADAPAMQRFAAIGIGGGGRLDNVPADDLIAAIATARQRITDYTNPKAIRENGWVFATDLGTYGTDYLLRAHTAEQELGANLPQDAVYPALLADAGEPGSPRRYRLRFTTEQLPPARAFWSLTAYTEQGYLVNNPARIYSVGHQVPVVPGPDGVLELAIQTDNPGPSVPQGNWLPIPESGKFRLSLRLYVPDSRTFDGRWQPPALTQV